jgi:MarR family 2-MHQ and catechol resistance regulon transcriptional repressor
MCLTFLLNSSILDTKYAELTMRFSQQYGEEADRALGLWVKLARAFATFNRATAEDIRSFGLTQPQFSVLETLGHHGRIPIGELSRKQLLACGTVTVVVDNLEKEGLVERRHGEEDRRMVYVQLTEKGTSLFREIFVKHAAVVAALASVLSQKEQDELSQLLKKLGTSLSRRLFAVQHARNRTLRT